MDDAPLARSHRAELVRRAGLLDLLRSGLGLRAQLFDALHAVVVHIEDQPVAILVRDAQGLERQLLQGQKQFRPAVQEHARVRSLEIDHQLGADHREPALHLEYVVVDVKVGRVEHGIEKVIDQRAEGFNGPFDVCHGRLAAPLGIRGALLAALFPLASLRLAVQLQLFLR